MQPHAQSGPMQTEIKPADMLNTCPCTLFTRATRHSISPRHSEPRSRGDDGAQIQLCQASCSAGTKGSAGGWTRHTRPLRAPLQGPSLKFLLAQGSEISVRGYDSRPASSLTNTQDDASAECRAVVMCLLQCSFLLLFHTCAFISLQPF